MGGKLPKDFLWGASTASHQVEGGANNQWSQWELDSSDELARTAQDRLGWLTNWQAIKTQAEDPANYISGDGVDHYHRYEEDFDILKELNLNAFRFGIEWSRLEPEPGKWDEEGIEHYRHYIRGLKRRGIEPVLNLWHWTLPVWFAKRGGFSKASNTRYFEHFVRKVIETYGHDLKYVITLNEPNVYTAFSYANGEWPPQAKNPLLALRVYRNLAQAHKNVYKIIKGIRPELQVGIAMNMGNAKPFSRHNISDKITAGLANYGWNQWFLNRVKNHQDFIGINYYFTDYWHWLKQKNPKEPTSDLGWYMEPAGIYDVLVAAHKRYHKPLIITENGLADAGDEWRKWWLEETFDAMRRAVAGGVDLRGYLHWSLLDNFEWKYGWWPKFGLVAVDRKAGMKRTVRPSARWLAEQVSKP